MLQIPHSSSTQESVSGASWIDDCTGARQMMRVEPRALLLPIGRVRDDEAAVLSTADEDADGI